MPELCADLALDELLGERGRMLDLLGQQANLGRQTNDLIEAIRSTPRQDA